MGGAVWVVKAQIHAGGRGKGGGVKVAKSLDEVRDLSKKIIGMQLITTKLVPREKRSTVFTSSRAAISQKSTMSQLF
jgi:succinyl-CoA synthetase beta subunit